MRKIKVCFVTAARSEYGLLKWLMKDINEDSNYDLQLIVMGGHLLQEQGNTIDQIIEDGFQINHIVDCQIEISDKAGIARTMGRFSLGLANTFKELSPDILFVLGDRYELLSICSTAFIMGIPIAHISGGDVTEGVLDDGIRNAVTMLSSYHFPGTEESALNIARMRNSQNNIWVVGEPGLDGFFREELINREELSQKLGLDIDEEWCLMTYHPETIGTVEHDVQTVKNIIEVLAEQKGWQIVCTYANTDHGGAEINRVLEGAAEKYNNFFAFPSLGQKNYLSMMKQVCIMIGNSSSGITEASVLGVPVINIGIRQKGRHQCSNVFQCGYEKKEIREVIQNAYKNMQIEEDRFYWGEGNTAEKIHDILNGIFRC